MDDAKALTSEIVRKSFRVVQDASFLTKYSKGGSIGVAPELNETICRLRDDTLLSFYDLSNSFHQVRLSSKENKNGISCRDLFGTYSYIQGIQYLRGTRAVQGFTCSSELCSNLFKQINDVGCAVPLRASVQEYMAEAERLEQ